MASQLPGKPGRKRDRYTSNAYGKSHTPHIIWDGGVLMVTQFEERMASASRCGWSNAERKSAPRTTIKTAASLTTPTKMRRGRLDFPEDHHHHREVLVHSLEQPVKGQHQEDQDHAADQIGHDTETEEPLVSGDVVDRRCRVPLHEEFAGDIDEARWTDEDKEQIPEPGHSPGLRVELIFPPSLNGPAVASDTWEGINKFPPD
jgi:hypothetical protein